MFVCGAVSVHRISVEFKDIISHLSTFKTQTENATLKNGRKYQLYT